MMRDYMKFVETFLGREHLGECRKESGKMAKIYLCDYCEDKLGEIACGNRKGGAYCSVKCAELDDEPITVDETQASPQVIDMLAHIAKELAKINRRLDKMEEHIDDTQRNVETFAQQTEDNTERIKKLESTSDLESGRVRKIDFDKDMLMRDIGSLNKRLEAFINDAR